MLCNNKANYTINHLFFAFFIFLFFDYKYLFTYYIFLVQSKNFNIFGLEISSFFLNFAVFRVIYINKHTFIYFNVILRNNKAISRINYLFIAFFSFLILYYKYLFTYYILLVQGKNFNIFGAKISWVFIFYFFRIIYNNKHTFIFFNVILCNDKAISSIIYLFIAFFSFLIFDYKYLFTYHILLVQRIGFQHFQLESFIDFF